MTREARAAAADKTTAARSSRLLIRHLWRKIFLEDWALKLIALVITIALWLGVTGLSTPTTKRFSVPLNLSVSNNAEITNTPIAEVDIVVTGDKRKIDQINRSDLVASVDLSDVAAGDRILSLTPETVAVPLPLGVRLDEVQPSRIAVRIEAVAEKDVAVIAELSGEPAAGFEVYDQTVSPQKIRVRGPASFIKGLAYLSTERINIAGATADINARQVPVGVLNPKATVLNTVVDVAVKIGEKRIERTLAVNAAGRKISVVLFGPKTIIRQISAEDLKAEIVKNDDGTETVQVTLPDNLQQSVTTVKTKILDQ